MAGNTNPVSVSWVVRLPRHGAPPAVLRNMDFSKEPGRIVGRAVPDGKLRLTNLVGRRESQVRGQHHSRGSRPVRGC